MSSVSGSNDYSSFLHASAYKEVADAKIATIIYPELRRIFIAININAQRGHYTTSISADKNTILCMIQIEAFLSEKGFSSSFDEKNAMLNIFWGGA